MVFINTNQGYNMKRILTAVLLVTLAACGSEDESDSTFLEGSWLSACDDHSEAGDGTLFGQSTYVYSGSNLVITNHTYDSTNCDGNEYASVLVSKAIVSVGDDVVITPSGETVTQFTFKITSQTLLYNQDADITDKNSEDYCDYNDWTAGVAKDVFSCQIGANTTVYDIALIDGDNLYFGEGVESGYPTVLSDDVNTRL
jgi:major membrane immunogen (membrane-anchored lipoprotein)